LPLPYSKRPRGKKISVQKAMHENKWISHIMPLSTEIEIQEYVLVWEAVQQIHLDTTGEDTVGAGQQMVSIQLKVHTTSNSKELSVN
jgi:hypothetical protein